MRLKHQIGFLSLLALLAWTQAGADTASAPDQENCPQHYPTAAVADYVLGCLLANGATPEMLQKCACSLDFIAASIPYDEYVRVETLLRMQQVEGAGRNAVYKNNAWSKAAIAHLKEVQAESTLRCF
jgi:hypothetical protein